MLRIVPHTVPVSAALTSIFRMDSNSTSYSAGIQGGTHRTCLLLRHVCAALSSGEIFILKEFGPVHGIPALIKLSYRGTSPIRKRPPPYDPPMPLGVGLR